MNYKKIYDTLIDRAKNRSLSKDIYVEKHHIIPRCLGGDDSSENLVELTAEEHFIAHQLLVKLNPGHFGLLSAVIFMATHPNGSRNTNKTYAWVRERFSDEMKKRGSPMKGKVMSEEHKKKIGKANKGYVPSKETLDKAKATRERNNKPGNMTGKKHSEESKLKMSLAKKGKKQPLELVQKRAEAIKGTVWTQEAKDKLSKIRTGKKLSEETKIKLSNINKGKTLSEETRRKMSESRKGRVVSEETRKKISESNKRTKNEQTKSTQN